MTITKLSRWMMPALLVGAMLFCSCDSEQGVKEYKEQKKSVDLSKQTLPPGHPPLNNPLNNDVPPNHPPLDKLPMPDKTAQSAQFQWNKPAEWQEKVASSMRLASFEIAGADGPADCSLVLLPQDGGGVLANINRWRGMVSLPPLTADELDKQSEKIEVAGTPAVLVNLQGNYQGMQGEPQATRKNARLIGMVAITPQGGLFVKMVGPDTTVSKEVDRFRAFCQSLTVKK
jgi:hypothetical protein